MRTREEEVRVNFGSQPFKTDVAGLVAAYTQSVHADIAAVALPGGALGKQQPLLPRLLFDHLVHERRWQTAAVVARDVLGGCVTFGAQQVCAVVVEGWLACGSAGLAILQQLASAAPPAVHSC
jgi:hypothetical protein